MLSFKLLTTLATLGVAYSQNVAAPILIWGNHHSIDKMTSNLGKITSEDINELIGKPIAGENTHVLIGILENLSSQDLFKKYGNEGVFDNVRKMMDQSEYTNFFAQSNGLSKKFREAANESITGVQNFVASSDPKQIHVIKITPKGEDDTETLKMSDNIMHKACSEHASQYKSYICVMTGSSGGLEGDHIRIARSLLSNEANGTEVKIESRIEDLQNVYYLPKLALIYTKTPPVFRIKDSTYNLTTMIAPPTNNGNNVTIQFQDKTSNTPGKKFRLTFNFDVIRSTWSLRNISYGDSPQSSILLNTTMRISTSSGYSFHTPSKVVFLDKETNISVTFNTLQIEFSSNLTQMRFSMADDTVYFFTIPILSGLFVTSLLVTIVLLGLSMIFDIKTMDLFDDPKGKTVTISAAE